MAKKLKGLMKPKKPYKLQKGRRIVRKVLEPKFKPLIVKKHPYTAEKFIKRLIRGKPAKRVRRPKKRAAPIVRKQKMVFDAKKKQRGVGMKYPSGRRMYGGYGGAIQIKPYQLRIPSQKKRPYSLAEEFPLRVTEPKKRRGKRVYKWLGPYPNPLGINEIFSIEMTQRGEIHFLRELGLFGRRLVIKLLKELRNKVEDRGKIRIGPPNRGGEGIIPFRSGDMRKSMLKSISEKESLLPTSGSRAKNIKLKMYLYCDVDYAGVVTGMDRYGSPHVAHKKSIYKDYPHAVDPNAVKKAYYGVLRDMKSEFKKVYEDFIDDLFNETTRLIRTKKINILYTLNRDEVKSWFDTKVQGRTWKF